jgi:ABC-type multidrug transport system fused ATPase/permease subunit
MKPFRIESTLFNRDAVLSTIWSTLQQLVVASSTYFILEAIRNTTAGQTQAGMRYIAAFVLSLVVVYLPNTLSMMYLQRWRLASIDSFVKAFARFNFGKTSFGHSRNKMHAEAWLTNECFTVYGDVTELLYQSYSTLMNSLVNILVIAAALDGRILLWYLLAGALLMVANYLVSGRIASVSMGVQASRKQLSNAMLTAWDNIFVGNRHNFMNWKSNYKDRMGEARVAATRYDLVRSLISSGTVSLALLIVAAGNGIFIYENYHSLPLVAALLITLPRQLQIIQSIFAFFNLTLSWTGAYAQLKELEKIVQVSRDGDRPLRYIQFNAIEISKQGLSVGYSSFESVRDALTRERNGRFTIRGKNGAGKSTLLGVLKEEFGDRAFYLPTHYTDLIFQSQFLNHSDGNRLLSVFNDITALNEIEFVILDEWDANLDSENVVKINNAIEAFAKNKVVIESRHRQ